MAYYRVPFFGSLLVETDIAGWADTVGGMWSASMRQCTHGAPMQPVKEEIKAVAFCVEHSKVQEVTNSLMMSKLKCEKRAKENPGGQVLMRMFCEVFSELQTVWDLHEFEAMRPESERGQEDLKIPE